MLKCVPYSCVYFDCEEWKNTGEFYGNRNINYFTLEIDCTEDF